MYTVISGGFDVISHTREATALLPFVEHLLCAKAFLYAASFITQHPNSNSLVFPVCQKRKLSLEEIR